PHCCWRFCRPSEAPCEVIRKRWPARAIRQRGKSARTATVLDACRSSEPRAHWSESCGPSTTSGGAERDRRELTRDPVERRVRPTSKQGRIHDQTANDSVV